MKRTALILLALGFSARAQLATFKAGQPASAAAVNANFELLQTRLDSLVTALKAKDAQIANLQGSTALTDSVITLKSQIKALQNSTALTDSVTSLRAKAKADSSALASKATADLASLASKAKNDSNAIVAKIRLDSVAVGTQSIPKGTVAGFLTAPGADGYLPGSNSTWLLAAGQGVVNSVTVPDLRGTFLRGIDYSVTGYAVTGRDSTAARAVGSYQGDAFQGHRHIHNTALYVGTGSSEAIGGGGNNRPSANDAIKDAITDGTNGTPRTAAETRPKNVAVYWYVKVK